MSHVRDRLSEFQQLQSETSRGKGDKNGGKKAKDNPKDFLEKTETIRQWINAIKENNSKINSILQNNTFYKSKEQQNELQQLFKNSETLALRISENLKPMRIDKRQLETETSSELKMKYLQYTSLQKSYQEVLKEHSECIEKHQQKLTSMMEQIQRTIQGDNDGGQEEIQRLMQGQAQIFTDNYLTETRDAQLQLRDLEQRHEELLTIENQLSEVRDLFVKIAILVEQQQESVDRAEYHAMLSSNAVETANNDLMSASKKKRKISKVKIYIGIVLVILLIITIWSFLR